MIRLSANSTLFFKLVVPVFFGVFYGMLSIFFLLTDQIVFADLPWLPYSNAIFYVSTMVILYVTFIRLLRVDCGEETFVVTNYIHAYRYSYDDVSVFDSQRILLWRIGSIRFKSKSKFGNKIFFLIDTKQYDLIAITYGNVFADSTWSADGQ